MANRGVPRLGMMKRIVLSEIVVTAHPDTSLTEEVSVQNLGVWRGHKYTVISEFDPNQALIGVNGTFGLGHAVAAVMAAVAVEVLRWSNGKLSLVHVK